MRLRMNTTFWSWANTFGNVVQVPREVVIDSDKFALTIDSSGWVNHERRTISYCVSCFIKDDDSIDSLTPPTTVVKFYLIDKYWHDPVSIESVPMRGISWDKLYDISKTNMVNRLLTMVFEQLLVHGHTHHAAALSELGVIQTRTRFDIEAIVSETPRVVRKTIWSQFYKNNAVVYENIRTLEITTIDDTTRQTKIIKDSLEGSVILDND